MCLLHVSVFCKLQDFIKQLGCCVTCFQPGDADGEQSTERRVRPSRVPRRCGRGRSMLALVSRYEERLQVAGDQGPGPPQPPVARGNLQPWKVRRREAAGGESSARRKWSSHDGWCVRPGGASGAVIQDVECGAAGCHLAPAAVPGGWLGQGGSSGLKVYLWWLHAAKSSCSGSVRTRCWSPWCRPWLLAATSRQAAHLNPLWAGPGPGLHFAAGMRWPDCSQPRQDRGTLTGRCSGFYIYMLLWWSQNPRLQRISTQTRLICSEVSILGRQQPAASKPSTEPTPNTPQNQIYNSWLKLWDRGMYFDSHFEGHKWAEYARLCACVGRVLATRSRQLQRVGRSAAWSPPTTGHLLGNPKILHFPSYCCKPQLTRKVDMDNPRKPKQSGKLLLTGSLTEPFYCASGSSGEVPSGGGHVTSSAAQRGEQLLTPGRVGADRPECARVPASYIHTTRIWSHETRTAHARPAQHGHQPSSDTGTLDTIIEKWDWR